MQPSTKTIMTIYNDESVPESLQTEIESILRAEWLVKPEDKNKQRDWDVTHQIFLSDETRILSYAAIARKSITHVSQTYDIIGLSGVITRQDQRGKGHGREIITAASSFK